jgi:hypothetical protein
VTASLSQRALSASIQPTTPVQPEELQPDKMRATAKIAGLMSHAPSIRLGCGDTLPTPRWASGSGFSPKNPPCESGQRHRVGRVAMVGMRMSGGKKARRMTGRVPVSKIINGLR